MQEKIQQRLSALREVMKQERIAAFIVPSSDAHGSEYVPEHWKARQWLSGFNGSAGTLVVTLHEAALWTDSRYFIAAETQLAGSGIVLMKERQPQTPSVAAWLGSVLSQTHSPEVAIDGTTASCSYVEALKEDLKRRGGITLRTNYSPFPAIWKDRPSIPLHKVSLHRLCYAGVPTAEKLAALRTFLQDNGTDGIFLSTLDDIAWLLNLRGNDVHCNPVFVAYLLVTAQHATLFIYKEKLTEEVSDYLKENHIEVQDYDRTAQVLKSCKEYRVLADPDEVNYTLFHAIGSTHVLRRQSPIAMMKAVKNDTEIAGFRAAMERDGVALVRFLMWLKPAVAKGQETERTASARLESLRAAQPLFKGNSFDTISAYEAHGAIVHYTASADTDAPLKPAGFLLLDSGAQYLDGTTDITRTLALGELTAEQRRIYTLVLKAHIALSQCKFLEGTTGTQLDIMARQPLWQQALNYGHGTGHGVGSYLNVHEGPQQIRMEYKGAPFLAGMTITDEPGVYLEGRFGVRIENVLLAVPYKTSEFGSFLQFEPLTLCPIDTAPIERECLTDEERQWLNSYHETVYRRLAPHLSAHEKEWLKAHTAAI